MFQTSILTGKTALVSGASRGIGRAIALGLGKAGATVIGTATSEAGAAAISDAFTAAGIQGQGLVLDVRSPTGIEKVLHTIKEQLGAVQILVNNAAVTKDNLILRMKEEEWQEVIDTDLTAIFRLSKLCLRDMLKARWGRIIMIGSVVGTTGNPGQVNYSAAKAGILGFSKSLAAEVGSRHITINTVAPGFISTDMTDVLTEEQKQEIFQRIPMQCLGTVEDIANAVTFLASDAARYITGQTLHVNGGMYMS